ncbi:MAG: FIG019045: long form Mg-chelase associated protein with vWA domain, partial [uncultured Thermomicrobiales bacterium]
AGTADSRPPEGEQPPDHRDHRRRADRPPRQRPRPVQLPSHAADVPGDAERGRPLHPRRDHDQHVHAGAFSLHGAVRQRPDANQRRSGLRRDPGSSGGVHPGRLRGEQAEVDRL